MSELNFIAILYGALAKAQVTLGAQQGVDAATTQINAQNEVTGSQYYYDPTNGLLKKDADEVKKQADAGEATKTQAAQTQYNLDSSRASAFTSQMDGMTQASQQQSNNDGTNLQMLVQALQAISSINTTLTSLLGRLPGK